MNIANQVKVKGELVLEVGQCASPLSVEGEHRYFSVKPSSWCWRLTFTLLQVRVENTSSYFV
jgi:hypothetical protein